MTDITLRSGAATDTGFASLAQLLKEIFSATPLGIALAVLAGKR